MREVSGHRVWILDKFRRPRWHPAWDGNPDLALPHEDGEFRVLLNCGGHRAYIGGKTPERWIWNIHPPTPAQLVFSAREMMDAPRIDGVVVEPNLKDRASPNKDWGWERWLAFAALCAAKKIPLVQLGPPGTRLLPGVQHVLTQTMREACAVLRKARAYVGHEGGLHHSAAALNVPAVVIFGGFISPSQTGYAAHRNLYTGGTHACGMRVPCAHCAAAMNLITPGRVLGQLEELLETTRRSVAA